MNNEVFNRYEIKYRVSKEIQEKLIEVILQHLRKDVYEGNSNFQISNVYYDTIDNSLITYSIEKPVYKEKFRIRGYGDLSIDSYVYFEIKKKYKGLVNKRRTKILLQDAYDFIETGELPVIKPYMNVQVMKELHYLINYYKLVPKLFIGYKRIAFLNDDNSIRITFDENIITRRDDIHMQNGFYGDNLIGEERIMEIKLIDAYPLWLCHLLDKYNIKPMSFSKYGTEYKKAKDDTKRSILYV